MKATTMPVRCFAALALCCACSCTLVAQSEPPATPQQTEKPSQAPFVFKTSSRLVVVDVVAINSKGEPEKVAPVRLAGVSIENGTIRAALKPASWNVIRLGPA